MGHPHESLTLQQTVISTPPLDDRYPVHCQLSQGTAYSCAASYTSKGCCWTSLITSVGPEPNTAIKVWDTNTVATGCKHVDTNPRQPTCQQRAIQQATALQHRSAGKTNQGARCEEDPHEYDQNGCRMHSICIAANHHPGQPQCSPRDRQGPTSIKGHSKTTMVWFHTWFHSGFYPRDTLVPP